MRNVPPHALARSPRPLRPGLAVDLWNTPIFDEVRSLYPELEWEQEYLVLQTWGGEELRMIPTSRLYTFPTEPFQPLGHTS